ncbi:hypothetical protein Aperf_G00000019984 [Anoplocephala perfoliata]
MNRFLPGFLLFLTFSLSTVVFTEATIYNVTIPSGNVSIPGASAYLLSLGEVKEDVERSTFAFDLPTEELILLYTFQYFKFPKLAYNSLLQCASLECTLNNARLQPVSNIAATCEDNTNPSLYGPIVTIPGASRVSCKVIWYYPEDKSALLDSLKLLFVAAYDEFCEYVPPVLRNSSKWCGVELKNLVDEDYEPIQKTLCLEERVAREVFNATCSAKPLYSASVFTPFRIVLIISGIIILIILIFALRCLARFCIKKARMSSKKEKRNDESLSFSQENRKPLFSPSDYDGNREYHHSNPEGEENRKCLLINPEDETNRSNLVDVDNLKPLYSAPNHEENGDSLRSNPRSEESRECLCVNSEGEENRERLPSNLVHVKNRGPPSFEPSVYEENRKCLYPNPEGEKIENSSASILRIGNIENSAVPV